MAHQVPWSKLILETFVQESTLTKEQEMIIRTRVAGWSRQRQAMELGMSLATVDRNIKILKQKYDQVQKYNPMLPPRRFSKEELYMDTH